MSDGYRFRTFRAGEAPAETGAWLEASALGFLQEPPTDLHVQRMIETYDADDRTLTAAYIDGPVAEGAWPASKPVATYGSFVKSLNVGAGRMLPAQLVATVTVRSTHHRRGLLREMITADLRKATEAGIPLAVLGSMEATLYGRYGFGPAIFGQKADVDVSAGFAVDRAAAGSVEVADPATLVEVAPTVFERFHQTTLGSVDRPASHASKIAGVWGEDAPDPDPGIRAALHFDEAGEADGYVSYRFLGWNAEPRTLELVDFVAATPDAYFGLWAHLGGIDLIDRIRVGHASMTDPLPWALADCRRYQVTGQEDVLWLRILDPVAALEVRPYLTDADISIALDDPLSMVSGVYRMRVRDGNAAVERHPAGTPADVSMDLSTLSSLYLGGASARVLVETGQLIGDATAVASLDRLFAQDADPHCITHF